MKKTWIVLLPLAVLLLGPGAMAQEHQFGLRVGNTNFDAPTKSPSLPVGEELQLLYLRPGCVDSVSSPGCTGLPRIGGTLQFTGQLLNDAVNLDTPVDDQRTVFDFRRDFDPEEFEGTFLAFSYEWRRDTDSRLSLGVDAGFYATDATHRYGGNVHLDDPASQTDDPFDFDQDGNTDAEDVPGMFQDTLQYTLYFIHVSPRYNFTTGKLRMFAGAGFGLWANLWREVMEVDFQNIVCDQSLEPGCKPITHYRQSDGDRRTIIPFSLSVGATYQFLPHWSFNIEDRWVFQADTNATLFNNESDFDIGGNQVILGFAYRL